jgi:hypothetical protein
VFFQYFVFNVSFEAILKAHANLLIPKMIFAVVPT